MNATHAHLMLNHLPVLGTAFGLLLLVLGLARRSEEWKRAGLVLFIVAALFALPTYLTGEPAEKGTLGLPGVNGAITERHEEVAQLALSAVLVLGGLSVSAFLLFRKGASIPGWFLGIVLVVALVTQGLMFWTANLGGQVRHTEIRSGPPLPE